MWKSGLGAYLVCHFLGLSYGYSQILRQEVFTSYTTGRVSCKEDIFPVHILRPFGVNLRVHTERSLL